MKGSKQGGDPKLQEIAGDVDSVAFLIDRLNEFLAGAGQGASADRLGPDVATAVTQLFLTLDGAWSPFTLSQDEPGVKDLDHAEKFLVDYFDPLLDAPSLNEKFLSGSPSAVTSTPFNQNLTQGFAPFFTRLENILVVAGFSQDQTNLVLTAVIGTVALCSFPLWTVYHSFHGYAAHTRVVPRLLDSLSTAGFVLNDVRVGLLRSASGSQANEFDLIMSLLDVGLRQALIQKANPYVGTFNAQVEALFQPRIRLKDADLKKAVEGVRFWKHDAGGVATVYLEREALDSSDKPFDYLGGIYLNGTASQQERSFLALKGGWETLEQAARLVSQAGLWLYVNAANNPYGGRHPPHNVHENGGDFDLGWTYIGTYLGKKDTIETDPKDWHNHKENLARMKQVKPNRGPIFSDPLTRKEFSLEPISQDQTMPETHAGIQRLAVQVALQAVALSGFKRYLYADAQNMRDAATMLGLAISPHLDPWSATKKAVIPFNEAMWHYNHIHAELFSRWASDVGSFLTTKSFTVMYDLAIERDNNEDFFKEMFHPRPGRPGIDRDESLKRIEPFLKDWRSRSAAKMPSLLPIWLSPERNAQLRGFPY
jgi:hypothetical protein